MKIEETELSGVLLLTPPRFQDDRGSFQPIFAERFGMEKGYPSPHQQNWAEMNLTHSRQGCIRGLHFQDPCPQAKLITVVEGHLFDVAVDLRLGSSFGKWQSFGLSASDDGRPSQIFLPPGFAHGFATPDGPATVTYLVDRPWSPEAEHVLAFDDPDLAINWPVDSPLLSQRDQEGASLHQLREQLLTAASEKPSSIS